MFYFTWICTEEAAGASLWSAFGNEMDIGFEVVWDWEEGKDNTWTETLSSEPICSGIIWSKLKLSGIYRDKSSRLQ